ncbi:MAG: type II toxin-antitoxin system RelE/ParE family toxin [Defluviitaleaceae bacterium]|nr:type II toxin-antitoxin system RelE/ParE family toxin [Defluviitaleaceae bacterium]
MISIVMSKEAENDLEQIGDYIARHHGNPAAAFSVIQKLRARIDRLIDFPYSGTPLSAYAEVKTDYRIIGSGNYLAFYHVQGDFVFVDRVLHSRRDYIDALLKK